MHHFSSRFRSRRAMLVVPAFTSPQSNLQTMTNIPHPLLTGVDAVKWKVANSKWTAISHLWRSVFRKGLRWNIFSEKERSLKRDQSYVLLLINQKQKPVMLKSANHNEVSSKKICLCTTGLIYLIKCELICNLFWWRTISRKSWGIQISFFNTKSNFYVFIWSE